MNGPLAGIRILDLTRLLPGPFATMVLGDLGASVDKIEDTGAGDYMRLSAPFFRAINRNKRSACLDLKKEGGKHAFLRLVERYDVVFEQFRPGVLARLGLGHDVLLARNPRLVVCALTGYGQDGPMAQRAGHDLNYLARAGVLGMQGPPDAPPQVPAVQVADMGAGLWCVIGILAALAEGARTGKGKVVDVALTEASMAFAATGFAQLLDGHTPRRGDEVLTGGIAPYGTYATRDGKAMTLGALEPKFWAAFCAGVGIEVDLHALMPGPQQGALKEKLQRLFASRTRAEWEVFGKEHECCLEPVLEGAEVTNDPQHRARGMFFEMALASGPLRQMRTPLTPRDASHTPPPEQGEHTEAILREASFEEAEIATMRSEGAIR